MAINIKFDLAGNPEPPTIILAKRNSDRLGQLEIDQKSIDLNDKLNDFSEFSFTLYKYIDNRITNLWDEVTNFKLVYCKEWDMWFEITVELDEETETIKTVMCTQLGQAELSQIMLYDIHINEEGDSNWNKDNKEYKSTILYDENNHKTSLLHRLIKDKAPHYSIRHVDDTIKNIQRTFSFDGDSIYDAFMKIAEEIGCLFVFHSDTDKNGKVQREFSVYDLQQNCLNPKCAHRGEFIDKCPKCDGSNIKYGYGEDTTIFVTSDELAADGIKLTTNTDEVKNCFKLEAGDDLMTATIRNCNPNGTDYIWYFSDDMKREMSDELVARIKSYDDEYKSYYNNYEFALNTIEYNNLVKKYKQSCINCGYINDESEFNNECPSCGSEDILINKDLYTVPSSIKGYSSLMNVYYNVIDLGLYLESGLMPSIEMSETNAEEQASLLTRSNLSPIAVEKLNIVSLATANSYVLSMAKIIVKSTYKVEINSSELSTDKKTWKGSFIVTNYSDDEDTAISNTISITLNENEETFTKQKIDKSLNKEDTDDYSISGLFKKELMTKTVGDKKVFSGEFYKELKKYALNLLTSFNDACQSCIDILIEQGAGNEKSNKDLYEKLYLPYRNKLLAIQAEIAIRESEINFINEIRAEIEELKNNVQNSLNFESYLGESLWLEFCSYRREDKYPNNNYISDGLNNAELFKKASEFIDVANDEIYKSAELQHSISTSLKNLLAIPKFEPLVKYFSVGNWIRIRVDEQIYKLRLLEYSINFGSFDEISVEFSDVTKIKTGITDVQEVLSQASSMATSYSSVQKQASQGEQSKGMIDQWVSNGLNSAQVRIQNNDTEDVVLDKNGLLCRSYNEITDTYEPEQFRLTHNMMAYTSDNWDTVSAALGKHNYIEYDKDYVNEDGSTGGFVGKTGYGLTANFVTAGIVSGSQIIGGNIYSENYSESDKTGSWLNLLDGTFSFAGGKLTYDKDHLAIDGEITVATSGTIGCWDVDEFSIHKGSESFGSDNGMYFGTDGLSLGSTFKVTSSGEATMTGADITGIVNAEEGYIGGWEIVDGSLFSSDGNNSSMEISSLGGGSIFASSEDGSVEHESYYSKYTYNDLPDNVIISGSGLGLYNYKQKDGSILSQSINFYIDGEHVYQIDNSGIYNDLVGIYINKNNIGISGRTIVSGGNIYLDNYQAIRGMRLGGTSYTETNSNAIGSVLENDRVALGGASNNAQTEVRSPLEIYFKCNSATSDDSRFAIMLTQGSVSDTDSYGYLVPCHVSTDSTSYTNLGGSTRKWRNVYAVNGTIETSDRNLKKDIEPLSDKYINMFDLLEPVSYKMLEGDRRHTGFIAQDVEEVMNQVGLTSLDFGGFCKDIKIKYDNETKQDVPVLDENGEYEYTYSLRYGEFIALNTAKIKQLEQKLEQAIEIIDKQQIAIEELKADKAI